MILSLTVTALFAQQKNVGTAAIRLIRTAEKADSHIQMIAHYLTDVSGPRLTNSPGFFRAGNWAVATMNKCGLVKAKLEPGDAAAQAFG